jgi:hypothetical protein
MQLAHKGVPPENLAEQYMALCNCPISASSIRPCPSGWRHCPTLMSLEAHADLAVLSHNFWQCFAFLPFYPDGCFRSVRFHEFRRLFSQEIFHRKSWEFHRKYATRVERMTRVSVVIHGILWLTDDQFAAITQNLLINPNVWRNLFSSSILSRSHSYSRFVPQASDSLWLFMILFFRLLSCLASDF